MKKHLTKFFMKCSLAKQNSFFNTPFVRKTAFVLAILMLFTCAPVNAAASAQTSIIISIGSREVRVDNTKLIMDSSYPVAQIINNRTYIPIRYVGILLDAEIIWDGDKREVTVKKDGITTSMVVGVNILTVNGSDKFPTDAAPLIIEDRTMVPVAILARALTCEVTWDEIKREATIVNMLRTDENTDPGSGSKADENKQTASGLSGGTESGTGSSGKTESGTGLSGGTESGTDSSGKTESSIGLSGKTESSIGLSGKTESSIGLSGKIESNESPQANANSTIDLDKYRLSTSKSETTGSISANTNKLVVSDIKDFTVGQGIAIEGLEEVSTSEDGTKNFTWFVAKILEIDNNTITINRTPLASGNNKRIIHDNYYVFRDIYEDNNGKDVLIKVPKGEYNVYAVRVICEKTKEPAVLVRDVSSGINPNNFPQDLFYYENKDSIYIDFNDSTINFNGEFYRGFDYTVHYGTYRPNVYSKLSFTTQLSMFRINNSSNVTIKNINIQFNANKATKSSEVAEAQSYGFVYAGVQNGSLINATVQNSITDGMIIRFGSSISKDITLENVKMIANSRQGLSVTAVDGLTIDNCEFSYTGFNGTYKGHAPMFGIDLELETTDSTVSNVLIKNSLFRSNYNGDVQLFQARTSSMEQKNIVIDSCLFYEPNVGSDSYFNGQIYVAPNNTMLRDFTIRNSTFVSEAAGSPKNYDNITIYSIKENPDLSVLVENNNFLGSVGIHDGANARNIFRNNNFLMEDHSRISRHNGIQRNSLFENSLFYITEDALAKSSVPFYASGYDLKDCYIYNEHPTEKLWLPVTTKDADKNIISTITFENVAVYGGISYGGITNESFADFNKDGIYTFSALKDILTNNVILQSYTALSTTQQEYMENRYNEAKRHVLDVLAKYNLTYNR